MDVKQILQKVSDGALTVEQASAMLRDLPYEDLGFAKLDHHRGLRSGFEEVVFCQSKQTAHLVEIFCRFFEKGINIMGTRASAEQFEAVAAVVKSAQFDPLAGIITVMQRPVDPIGLVAVCTGGTADYQVAEEAACTATFFGSRVERYYDVGVSGIHRLLDKLPQIRQASAVVAVAGMEGALPGVLAGLLERPVIAVPTSVGYGSNFGGLSALLTMLNSCAEGIGVVNIDNGFGAGYLATQINRLACGQ